jgi:hypothetical protein
MTVPGAGAPGGGKERQTTERRPPHPALSP